MAKALADRLAEAFAECLHKDPHYFAVISIGKDPGESSAACKGINVRKRNAAIIDSGAKLSNCNLVTATRAAPHRQSRAQDRAWARYPDLYLDERQSRRRKTVESRVRP